MSSVESAPMSSSEVSEKGTLEFGVKAVSLKTQTDASSRLVATGGGALRALPSPVLSRQTAAYGSHPSPTPVLANLPQKSVNLNRGSAGAPSTSSVMSSGAAVTAKPALSTCTVTSTTPSLHASATYLLPRGSTQVSNLGPGGPRGPPSLGRPSMSLQPVSSVQTFVRSQTPVGVQTGPVSSVQTLVRTQSPMGSQTGPVNHMRAPSPGCGPQRTMAQPRGPVSAGKPGSQARPDVSRPIVLPSAPSRPLTITPTSQLHITEKGMKMPVGAAAQVLPIRPTFCSVPTFVGQNQTTTILQRTDGVGMQSGASTTVLTTPVRLTPPLAPLLTTQRVAVSVGTRLNMQQQVTVASMSPSSRGSAPGGANRGAGPPGGPPAPPPKMGVSTIASGAILTSGRVAYATGHLLTGAQPPVSRITTQGPIAAASKPMPPMVGPTATSAPSRMPLVNHQPPANQLMGGKPRLGGPRASNAAPVPPAGLLVHSQLMVTTTGNHVAGVRPTLASAAGTKVIQQPGATQLTSTPPSVSKAAPLPPSTLHLTPVITKPTEVYKLGPSMSLSRLGPHPPVSAADVDHSQTQASSVYLPTSSAHRTNPSPGVMCSQAPLAERPANTPTLSTYTLPSGASYFYEAPSGYQLATDAPLVARPLSPDTPHVARQLSTEGPLIARPYTPGVMGTSQAMRFNPVMIVEQGSVGVAQSSGFPVVTTTSSDQSCATTGDPATPAKITSSPRPSILRKRDNDGNVNMKVVKNLSGALSGTPCLSRTPSPATPPTSLHLETSQTGADVGPSSNGSTTISATSSPGPEDAPDPDRPQEMSPRKKPRKQLLNDANDSIDMEFISGERMKKEKEAAAGTGDAEPKVYLVKRPSNVSLLRTYKHSWKARNNHFQRYTDVRPREERRPSVTELASQRQVVQRVKGWKIYHLSTQLDHLSDMESCVLDRLSTIFKAMDPSLGKEYDNDVSRVNELIMGNIQRSKVIRDQMLEAKMQMLKGFDHKVHVSEIISRCASKRNFKKRDKY